LLNPAPTQLGTITVVTKYTALHHDFQELLSITISFLIGKEAAEFCLLQNVQTGSETHTASYSKGNGGALAPECKAVAPYTDYRPPSNAEVRNEWSYTSILP
jgi:hypothetical protein